MGWAYHFCYFVLLEACPACLAKVPTSYLAWPVCPAPLAFPVSKRGIGQSWQVAPISVMDTRWRVCIGVHMYCICACVFTCANPPVNLSWQLHFYTHKTHNLPSLTALQELQLQSVFPPIFSYMLFAFPKQDESSDGSIQRSFIFRRRGDIQDAGVYPI